MTLNFTINALSHCDWSDCPEQLVEQAQGKRVLLVAEEDNVDSSAVRVHFRGGVAGYVCRDDAPMVRAVMSAEGRQSWLAVVTGSIRVPYYKLKASCACAETTALSADEGLNQQYDAWVYTGPLLPASQTQKELEGAVEYLSYVVGGELAWDEESRSYFETFLRLHKQDFSDEMFHFRHRLIGFFENRQMERERQEMALELHAMSRHEHRQEIEHIIAALPSTPEFGQMMAKQGAADVPTLLAQMLSFPDNLAVLALKGSPMFCQRIYYAHPHRRVLRRFFSGMAVLQFYRQNGLLQNWQELSGSAAQGKSSAGLERLANQINLMLGSNPSAGY